MRWYLALVMMGLAVVAAPTASAEPNSCDAVNAARAQVMQLPPVANNFDMALASERNHAMAAIYAGAAPGIQDENIRTLTTNVADAVEAYAAFQSTVTSVDQLSTTNAQYSMAAAQNALAALDAACPANPAPATPSPDAPAPGAPPAPAAE